MPTQTGLDDHESRIVDEFCQHYGLTFRDPSLVKLALTHRSYLHVTGQRDSNERLEFLGDSVLGLVTSEFLYRAHPNEHEGQLTKTKSLLVSKAILSRRALAMGLGRFVLMSHSEVESGGRQRLSILADAFESVVGAVYLDQGFEASRAFIERWLLRDTRSIVADKRHTNYKSHLQEYVQSTYRTHPVYRIRSEVGPDHSKQFMVEVIVGKRTLGEGKGRNKKEAEQAAARNALEGVGGGGVAGAAASPRRVAPGAAGRGERRRDTVAEQEPLETETEAEAETDIEEREVISRPRRRGRRGGRGRRRLGEPDEGDLRPAEASRGPDAPEPRAPEPKEKPAEPLRERPVRSAPRIGRGLPWSGGRPEEREPIRPREFEPPPSARDEDENEEIGRPEGPREETRVDPYAWGSQDFAAPQGPREVTAPEVEGPPVPSAPEWPEDLADEPDETGEEERAEPPESAGFEAEGGREFDEDDEAPEAAPSPETQREGTPPPVVYGRRGGRSRR